MRKIILIGLLAISFFTNAQFVKGDKVLGGNFSFYSQSAPDSPNGGLTNNVRRFSITPTMGFMISKNFAIGGEVGFASSYQEILNYPASTIELNSRSISAGIIGQQYFKVSDKFLFSLIGQFNFSRGFETEYNFDPQVGDFTENGTQNYQLTTSIRPSFIFFPSPKWGFEASMGAISHTFSRNLSTDEKVNRLLFNYGTISFGVGYYFLKANR